MARKTKYSDETRAAVMTALLEGQSVNQVAKEYKIPKSTAAYWKTKAHSTEIKNAAEIGDLILEFLRTNLNTLQKQAEFFSNVDWLKTQNAADLGVLYGIISDKTMRILEAYGSHEES